jgi:hypothetical protein
VVDRVRPRPALVPRRHAAPRRLTRDRRWRPFGARFDPTPSYHAAGPTNHVRPKRRGATTTCDEPPLTAPGRGSGGRGFKSRRHDTVSDGPATTSVCWAVVRWSRRAREWAESEQTNGSRTAPNVSRPQRDLPHLASRRSRASRQWRGQPPTRSGPGRSSSRTAPCS